MTGSSANGGSVRGTLLRGGAWALASKGVIAVSALAINAALTRLLPPEAMGTYFIAFSVVMVMGAIGQVGMSQSLVRMVAESVAAGLPGRARAAIRRGTLRTAAATAACVLFLYLGGGRWLAAHVFDSPALATLTGLVAVWVAAQVGMNLLAEILRGFQDIRRSSIVLGLGNLAVAAALWIAVAGHQAVSLSGALALSIAGYGLSVAAAALYLGRKLARLAGPGTITGGELWSVAWPIWVTNLSLLALVQADIWILGAFLQPERVAAYAAASRLVILVAMPLVVVNAVVPPLIARLNVTGRSRELERTLRATATVAGIPATLVLLVFIAFGGPVLGLVYGDFYRGAWDVLALLSVGQLVNVLVGSCGMVLMMTGHQRALMTITLGCGGMMVVGGLLAVRPFGTTGVAACAMAGMIAQNLLMLWTVRARLGIWTHVFLSPAALPLRPRVRKAPDVA